jgi:hypothetical protein
MVQFIEEAFGDVGIEESHLIGAMIEDITDAELDGLFHQDHIIIKIGEGDFGFNHPELGSVARSVALFGPESRPKGIDVAERHRKSFDVELTRNG